MKAELSKLFGVKEGEEFTIEDYEHHIFTIIANRILYQKTNGEFTKARLTINEIANKEIKKIPKRKQFTDDELCILRQVPKENQWCARNKGEILYLFIDKPTKNDYGSWVGDDFEYLGVFNHLFQCIKSDDDEPVYIPDYVKRD